jgi:hypothetical protein
MTHDLEITCLVKPAPLDGTRCVASVGGPGFHFDLDVAVGLMQSGQVDFYVWHEGKYVDVEVVIPESAGDVVAAHPWLRTVPDGKPLDTLEHLTPSLQSA